MLMTVEKDNPKRFFWFKRWVSVAGITDAWKEIGRWWEGDPERLFFRVLSTEGGMYEVYAQKKEWNLYKVYD